MKPTTFILVAVCAYMCVSVCAVESTMVSGPEAANDGWIFIPRPDGQLYRQCVSNGATLLAVIVSWSLGSMSAGYFNGAEDLVTSTTTTTMATTSSFDATTFLTLCGLLCALVVVSAMLVKARRALYCERIETHEMGKLCSALWDEQKEQKVTIAEHRKEIRELRDENAAVQLAYYELPHGRQCTMRDASTQT